MSRKILTTLLITILASICHGEKSQMDMVMESVPDPLMKKKEKKLPEGHVSPTYANIAYGKSPKQRLDFFKAKSSTPTPVIVLIHGGGWSTGARAKSINENLLRDGISYCTISYRLCNPKTKNVMPVSVMDAARAIQFIRSKAREWNIDPEKIMIQGGSAGGASSLWLAFHDDMAKPDSADPVERQSTRISGAVAFAAQTTINPFLISKRIGDEAAKHPMVWQTIGAKSHQDLIDNWEQFKDLSEFCSPLTHLSSDDPPVYLIYSMDTPFPAKTQGAIHHAEFGRILKEKCDEIGVGCTMWVNGKEPSPTPSWREFTRKTLTQEH